MLDLTTEKGRYISAALALAGERPWNEVTLADIAERAGSTLVGLKAHFAGKGDIVRAFTTLVDDEVLARAPRRTEGQAARDALFEVIMSRFDVLEPWKPGIRSIVRAGMPEPGQMAQVLASQRWMLEAAGIGAGGVDGAVRTAGLASVYASVFRIWLEDSDPGLARTMAALDRRLRRGERSMRRAEDVMKGFGRIAGALFGAAGTVRSRMDEVRRGARRGASTEEAGTTTPPPGV
jgi:AcrR family transcriptional regulator